MRSYLERTRYHYLFDNKALAEMSDSCRWLPTSFEPKSSKGPPLSFKALVKIGRVLLICRRQRIVFPLLYKRFREKIQGLFNLETAFAWAGLGTNAFLAPRAPGEPPMFVRFSTGHSL